MKHFITAALVAVTAAALTACGGGDDDQAQLDCIPGRVYQDLIDSGAYQPRPWQTLPPNYLWLDPYVVIQNPSGLPPIIGVFGPFYIPGEVPAYVCKENP